MSPHCHQLSRIPLHIPLEAFEDLALKLPGLKHISCDQRASNLHEVNVYLEYEEHSSPPCDPRDGTKRWVALDGQKFGMEVLNTDSNSDAFKNRVTFITRKDEQSTDSPIRNKRFHALKDAFPEPTCYVCSEKLGNDVFAPCLDCSRTQCRECLIRNFDCALRDLESMPVQCCGKPLHPDTVLGVLKDEEIAKYKLRFQEMAAKHPFYCPVPKCATFIPPRKVRIVAGRVKCYSCKVSACYSCREVAGPNHICSSKRVEEDKMLAKYGYKRCPNCRTGQAKMFGCSHMRCLCGTHWCWQCNRISDRCICHRSVSEGEGDNDPENALSDIVDIWDDSEDDDIATPASSVVEADVRRKSDNGELDTPAAQATEARNECITNPAVVGDRINDTGISQLIAIHDEVSTPHQTATQQQEYEALPSEAFEASEALASGNTDQRHDVSNSDTSIGPNPEAGEVEKGESREVVDNLENLDSDSTDWQNGEHYFGPDPGEYGPDPWDCNHANTKPLTKDMLNRYFLGPSDLGWWYTSTSGYCEKEIGCMLCSGHGKIKVAVVGQEKGEESIIAGESSTGMNVEQMQDSQQAEDKTSATKLVKKDAYLCGCCGVIACGRCKNVVDQLLQRKQKARA